MARLYAHGGLPFVLRTTRIATLLLLGTFLTAATWGVSELEENAVISETQDVALTVAAIAVAGYVARAVGRHLTEPLAHQQAEELRESLAEEKQARLELQGELDRRQAFIEQANHHLRTPVTIIYGTSQLLAARGDEFSSEHRAVMRQAALKNAERLKEVVEDLSVFLDEQVAFATHEEIRQKDSYVEERRDVPG